MATRSALVQEVKRKRASREAQRQSQEASTAQRSAEEASALHIQRVVRGCSSRRRWAEEDWQRVQKQLGDLDKLAQVVRQKGQSFVAPTKILQGLMIRIQLQRRRAREELARWVGVLTALLAAALCAAAGGPQRSYCGAIGASSALPPYVPDPGPSLLRFAAFAVRAVAAARGPCADGARELARLLDARAWGAGRALDELPACLQLAPLLLLRTAEGGLQAWRVAALAAAGSWSGGSAPAPERLSGLAALATAWLRLSEFGEPDACGLLEAIMSVSRIGRLIVDAQAGNELPLPWARLLRAYARQLDADPARRGGGEQQRTGSAKSLDREYMLVYLAGNLWEVHGAIGLPLEPFLLVQARLAESLEVSMLPGAPSQGADEALAVIALRQQLRPLVEASAIARLFSQVLHFGASPSASSALPRQAELARAAQRPYQRHCLAVALMEVSPIAVEALCRLYSTLLLKVRMAIRASRGSGTPTSIFNGIASTIAYMEGGDVARALWRYSQGFYDWRAGKCPSAIGCYHVLHLQAVTLSQLLSVMSDEELQDDRSPFIEQLGEYIAGTTRLISQLTRYSEGLEDMAAGRSVAPSAAASVAVMPPSSTAAPPVRGVLAESLLEYLSRALGQLQSLAGRLGTDRRPPTSAWRASAEVLHESGLTAQRLLALRSADEVSERAMRLLRYAPFSVPFEQRVALLRLFAQQSRERAQGVGPVRLIVRRTHLFEDGLAALRDANWHARFQVVFVNAQGRQEQGQDAGGLFKEFLETLAEQSFNPEYGLFRTTESRLLFPNPEAYKYHEGVEQLFEFLGLVVGKGILEGIVLEPSFAPFFLAKLQGRRNSYYDLQSLDPSLFSNLQRLKGYDGNVEDLCCTFVAATVDGREVPLIPGGQDIAVTNESRFKYIYMLSDYKLNVELKAASDAFLAGFQRLVDERWLRLFGEDELQQVISGSNSGSVDIDDLRAHTRYSNCGPKDKLVNDFFYALKAMKREHHGLLLRFVTSCSRVPLLGFGHLVPQFTILRVQVSNDGEKLPTASTCFNTLKLPTYSNWKVMKQKLEYVIEQGAGFELD